MSDEYSPISIPICRHLGSFFFFFQWSHEGFAKCNILINYHHIARPLLRIKYHCYRLNYVPPNLYGKALIPNVPIFGNKVFNGDNYIKWDHKGGDLIQQNWCLYKKRKRHQGCTCPDELPYEDIKMAASCNPKRKVPETNPTCTLILDFQPPEMWENIYMLFKAPSLYCVMAALAG